MVSWDTRMLSLLGYGLFNQPAICSGDQFRIRPLRTFFTAARCLNFFFTDQVIAGYKLSLEPPGQIKTMETVQAFNRGGMYGWVYKVVASLGTFAAFSYVTSDGKLDQLLLRR